MAFNSRLARSGRARRQRALGQASPAAARLVGHDLGPAGLEIVFEAVAANDILASGQDDVAVQDHHVGRELVGAPAALRRLLRRAQDDVAVGFDTLDLRTATLGRALAIEHAEIVRAQNEIALTTFT